ncbi:hypothetical protein FCH28_14995 [Streptomyces piniterrae]|uniref:Uncharacterized protein n=1 Tax=Streptomyces piniterrae TaxID=2571125 RepID=A0A4U0NJP7_9ACTN|nr:hypothetical protein [Streptomyces piniterrae]TJZ54430.1 hypothetical protein FCH28_14995 [Streptomyces piniterrae]
MSRKDRMGVAALGGPDTASIDAAARDTRAISRTAPVGSDSARMCAPYPAPEAAGVRLSLLGEFSLAAGRDLLRVSTGAGHWIAFAGPPRSQLRLRARIQLAPDVLSGFDRTPALPQMDTVCRLVEDWLRIVRLGYSTSPEARWS